MLQGWQIGILRPLHQAQSLFDKVQQLQGKPILLPLFDVAPLTITQQQLTSIRLADFVLIASANVLFCAPSTLIAALEQSSNIITMGKATTQALVNKIKKQPFYTAPPGSTSESILTETFFQPANIAQKKVVLLAGEAGRTLLEKVLQNRKANVDSIMVYALKPIFLDAQCFSQFKTLSRFCFVATSARILEALFTLMPQEDSAWLTTRPLIVVSERIHLQAKECGFKHIFVAPNPHPEGIEVAFQKMVCDILAV